ncbi:MAG: sigma-54-dependent Fis family transcriptional regulator, partial [Deltaproteobacteria bacterium]|nr:sigma-54-dependent Fis family transcriptional regulator [Deltaproteobacteria bacterium]
MIDGRPKILVVDDGDRYIELAHALLRDYDYATRCELSGPCWTCEAREGCVFTHAHDWSETVQALARHPDVDVVLLDVDFELPAERLLMDEDGDLERSRRLQGISILRELRKTRGLLPVVLMTSIEELQFEDAAQSLDVDEFATLAGTDAFDARALGLLIERILARRREVVEAGEYRWGGSPGMARLRRDATSLARTSLPILILGETGTGKSALAELVLHPATGRDGPFVISDLAAIPQTLMASELFGSARGAFSGSVDRAGCFERASGGTLFLDEIGNLPTDVQHMLLLALQSGRITRLGEGAPRQVDVKLVAATNVDLEGEVRAGRFRGDLYARLNPAARMVIPPLRERVGDLEDLAERFVQRTFSAGPDYLLLESYMKAAGLVGPSRARLKVGGAPEEPTDAVIFVLSRRTLSELRGHHWPGNVRELELLMANAAIFALSDAIRGAEQKRAATQAAPWIIPIPAKLVRELLDASWLEQERETVPRGRGMLLEIASGDSMRSVTRDLEIQIFKNLFEKTDGDFEKIATRLL